MRRIPVAPGAGVYAEPPPVLTREARQRQIVQIDKVTEQGARGIYLHGEPALGEVDLYLVRSLLQAAPHFRLVLTNQIVDELIARIARKAIRGIHEAQGGWRDDGLLQGYMRVLERYVQILIGVPLVSKRLSRE